MANALTLWDREYRTRTAVFHLHLHDRHSTEDPLDSLVDVAQKHSLRSKDVQVIDNPLNRIWVEWV